MNGSFRSGVMLIAGLALLGLATALQAILLETVAWTLILAAAGAVLAGVAAFRLRSDLGAIVHRRRGEIAAYTLGLVGVLLALAYLSAQHSLRFDLSSEGRYSLSDQTVTMLQRL